MSCNLATIICDFVILLLRTSGISDVCYDTKNDFCSKKFMVKRTPAEKQVTIQENILENCHFSSWSSVSIAEGFQQWAW